MSIEQRIKILYNLNRLDLTPMMPKLRILFCPLRNLVVINIK